MCTGEMGQQRQRATAQSGGKTSQQQQPQQQRRTPKKQVKATPRACWLWALYVAIVALLLAGGVLWYRDRYPAEQRCPPEDDRFHDHCMEGRKHYLLSLDWSCARATNNQTHVVARVTCVQ